MTPKLGRWFYCKYCYKNIRPLANSLEGIVVCPECNYGLAPLEAVIEAGSLQAWYEQIERAFYREARTDGKDAPNVL